MINLIILSLSPVFIIALYIYFRDKYEKEPWQLLLKAILAGTIITIPIGISEKFISWLGLGFEGIFSSVWNAFFVAAFCEETFKYMAVFLLFWNRKEFNEKFDGIIYAAFVSLGFAGIENLMYVLGSGYATGIARALTAVPAHALMGITMGYYLGLAKFYPKKKNSSLKKAFIVPFLIHGFYDFILMSGKNYLLLLFIPLVIFMWITALRKMKKHNETSIFRDDLYMGIDFSRVKDYKPPTTEDWTS